MSALLIPLLILALVGSICGLVGFVMLIVAAFRVSTGWGLGLLVGMLCTGPLGLIILLVFLYKYLNDAEHGALVKRGATLYAAAFVSGLILSVAMPSALPTPSFDEIETADSGDWEESEDGYGEGSARPTSAPPTPAPSYTPYIPRLLPTSTPSMRRVPPPRPTVFVLTPDTAGQRIGWTLEVTSTDGRVFEAVLIGVTEDVLQFEQRVGGGTVIFPIPKEEVVSMKELQ